MTVSILHRVTGVAMSAGLVVLAAWLMSAAAGGEDYEQVLALLSSFPGQVLLFGWSFAFFFHLANGVRHLVWDVGRGFEIRQANASAWFVLIVASVLTLAYWFVLL